jgi:putative ABC transport system permease protein
MTMPFRGPRWLRRFAALFTWDARDADMTDEMQHHLESLIAELERGGLDTASATLEARRRFGSVVRMKEGGHDERRSLVLENLVRDIRHMARGLRRSPGFATAVILTLAVGIGGNTAIFSVVDQVLLRPLPYPEGDRLLILTTRFDNTGAFRASGVDTRVAPCNCVSPADWLDWQRDNRTLDSIAVWRSNPVTLTGVGDPVRLNNQGVSAEFFHVLGVPPLLGRTFNAEDDRPIVQPPPVPGRPIAAANDGPIVPRVAVISYRLWQQRFGANPKAVGRTVQMNGIPTQIVGIMPEQFRFLYQDNDVWTPLQLDRTLEWRKVSGRFLDTIARRKAGTTLATARGDLEGIANRLAATHDFNKRTGINLIPLRDELTGPVQTSLIVLYAAVAVLLAIACFNVANLLLLRASTRSREIAVRTSLGAGRASIFRQLLVESFLLALAGGALGIALAQWSVTALTAFAPPDLLRVPEVTIDTRVLLYAVGISVLTGVVCGVAPAALVGLRPLALTLRGGGTTVTHAPRLRQLLVISQVAMTVILLCGAGLFARTLVALTGTAQPFDRRDVLTMEVSLPRRRYQGEQPAEFFRRAVEAMRGIPGVSDAAAAYSLPIVGSPRGATTFHRVGAPQLPPNESPVALVRVVTPGYFRTLRIPVKVGREYVDGDTASAGFVVNEMFVNSYLPGLNPLQVDMTVAMQAKNPYLPIIGVVADTSEGSIRASAQPTVFYNEATMPEATMTMILRTPKTDATILPAIAAIHRLDSGLAVTKVATFEDALADSVARERLNAVVSGGFAVSGLLLASLGIYGLLAFIVNERTREMAIRIALGAHVRRLTRSVVARGLRLVAIGAMVGLGASVLLLRSVRTLLFDVTPYDAPTYALVLALLTTVAGIASYVPARRASRVEPLMALREE